LAKLSYLLICSITVAALAGCATAPGQIQDSEFLSKSIVIDIPVAQALVNFEEGFRQCGFESPGVVFAVHYGEPVCTRMRPDGTVVCDVYIRTLAGRSPRVHGRVDFTPVSDNSTNAVLRVLSSANRLAILDAWERFLRWSPKSTCPTS
jgi:hypothetical protein